MDLEIIILSEISQKKTNANITYMWDPNYDTNEPIYETETESQTENRLVVAKGEEVGEGWSGMLGLADVSFYI